MARFRCHRDDRHQLQTDRRRRSFREYIWSAPGYVPIGFFFLPPDELDSRPVHLDLADGPDTRYDPGLLIDLVVSDEGSTIEERLVELTRSLGGDALARLRRQTSSHPAVLGERWLRRLSRAQEELTELAAEVEVLVSGAMKARSASRRGGGRGRGAMSGRAVRSVRRAVGSRRLTEAGERTQYADGDD